MTSIRVLGIDPGSRKMGFGIIDVDSGRRQLVHVAHGVLRFNVKQELSDRMSELAHRLKVLIEEHQPQHSVLEDIFVSTNLRSALILGQARGAVLATLGLAGVSVSSLNPTVVKQAITGSGHAGKEQVGHMVRVLLGLSKKPPEDAGDALGLAICCGQKLVGPQPLAATRQKSTSTTARRRGLYELAKAQGLL